MRILGISALYHDSAAALVVDGEIIAAAQEERFTRIKHDANFPGISVEYCLKEAGLGLADIDRVVFYDKPYVKFERLMKTYLAFAPLGCRSFAKSMPVWLGQKLFQKNLLANELKKIDPKFSKTKLAFTEHHLSHAASAFYPSPFEEAAVLTMDGVGEWTTTSLAIGKGNSLNITREIHFPHSLGLLYSAFTHYTGFKVNSGEYKIMGLAAYGEPRFASLIKEHLIDVKEDGSFRLDMSYFDYATGLTMTSGKFDRLFGSSARNPKDKLTQREMDLAASVQAVLEEVVLKLTRNIAKTTRQNNLCLAGGVALNCVANGKILRDGAFQNVWVQPASGDAGGALGAALYACHALYGEVRHNSGQDGMKGSYLGPDYSQTEIERRLTAAGAEFKVLTDNEIIASTAGDIAEGKAIGWFQGRMEFGPRALGGRSILGDARSPKMQQLLNLKVKYRESFRPFAPSILREDVAHWFELDGDSPYMLIAADVVKSRRKVMSAAEQTLFGIEKLNVPHSDIPAVTHVDYSARIQTVAAETNARYHALILAFKQMTGCPVIVNTSFNVRGEPLVCTPEDAFRCFMGTEIDVLVVGNCRIEKTSQVANLKLNYETAFELD